MPPLPPPHSQAFLGLGNEGTLTMLCSISHRHDHHYNTTTKLLSSSSRFSTLYSCVCCRTSVMFNVCTPPPTPSFQSVPRPLYMSCTTNPFSVPKSLSYASTPLFGNTVTTQTCCLKPLFQLLRTLHLQ